MKILIGADIVPTKENINYFKSGEISKFIDDNLINKMQEFDYRICNLETPLCEKKTPIEKCGSNHMTSEKAINGIKNLGINLCTLANNHILDQGDLGLNSTVKVLEKNKIDFVGVGNNLEEAKSPFYISKENECVGVYNCAEHEFSIATDNSMGANPYDPLHCYDQIINASKKCDFIIVIYHGGKEYYQFPSPELQKICRKFIDSGADLVICQHSHCIGANEEYNNGNIIYGQGNFIFHDESNLLGEESILISIDTCINELKYIPICDKNGFITLAGNEEKSKILEQFNLRSEKCYDKFFINQNYLEFAKLKANMYLKSITGRSMNNFLFKVINKISRGRYLQIKINKLYKKKNILQIQNYIECEAHRELLLQAIKSLNNK